MLYGQASKSVVCKFKAVNSLPDSFHLDQGTSAFSLLGQHFLSIDCNFESLVEVNSSLQEDIGFLVKKSHPSM